MKKTLADNLGKALPGMVKNAIDYLKNNFDKKGQAILENAGGTLGVLIGIFAQPLIDKYFSNLAEKKMEDFGFNVYLKAALLQAGHSLQIIQGNLNNTLSPEAIFDGLDRALQEETAAFDKENTLLIFQPLYHPAVVFVKDSYQRVLRNLDASQVDIKAFTKHFNENIEATIKTAFGDTYTEHLNRTNKFRLKDNETKFLWDIVQNGKISLKAGESLKYERTFAEWKNISALQDLQDGMPDDTARKDEEREKKEATLRPVEDLIEEYFSRSSENHLKEILFLIADFGKGKSVFLKHYAAEYAREFLQTGEGFFPIYFNLRNFKSYSSDGRLGVINDYLETAYGIKIDDPYFAKKKYVFLIDSLDESGELNKRATEKVLQSIKNIQDIDKALYRTNRIIVTSRPFDDGLSYHLNEHQPYVSKNKENRDVPQFISVYGFTKDQFNNWLIDSLREIQGLDKLKSIGFSEEIIVAVRENKPIDIYTELLRNRTLSPGELRRPIFAYMIYQLIINSVDFSSIGKIGVYLSFINLLTKEAKHINETGYRVNLKEEFAFRNILHATAALWMKKRAEGGQGLLSKADICRVLEGKNSGESDSQILERFKQSDILEIQFLSHSYFGENDNILHFQHQSFAEILLAEYYLKVFIKFALDKNSDLEEARIALVHGNHPTGQTIDFLVEMLQLLKETTGDSADQALLEKRKLLFPLMASLATQKHNRLFCNNIYYSWFDQCTLGENQVEYPIESLKKWAIDEEKLKAITKLTAEIINSQNTYLPVQVEMKASLFNPDIAVLRNRDVYELVPHMDKWLALLVGNTLYNNFEGEKPKIFNRDYEITAYYLLLMIRMWNHAYGDSASVWAKGLFKGINITSETGVYNLSNFNFDGIDFSYSTFEDLDCWNVNLSRCIFNHCRFKKVEFFTCLFYEAAFRDIEELDNIKIYNGALRGLARFELTAKTDWAFEVKVLAPETFDFLAKEPETFNIFTAFIIYGLANGLTTVDNLKGKFFSGAEHSKRIYIEHLESLRQYEKSN